MAASAAPSLSIRMVVEASSDSILPHNTDAESGQVRARLSRIQLWSGHARRAGVRFGAYDAPAPDQAVSAHGAMLKPLRFASPYYSRRAGRLAFSTIATALQSLLFIPALLLVRRAFDVAIPSGDVTGLIWIGAGIVGIRAATGGFSLLLRAFMLRTTRGAVADLRGDLMARLYSLSRRYFTRADYANLHTRIVQDTQRIEANSQKLLSVALPALLTVPVLAGLLFYLDWRLFLIGLLLVPLLWFATRITSRNVREQVVRNQRAFERFSKSVSFAIHHIDLTRVRAFESEEVTRQRSAIDGLS